MADGKPQRDEEENELGQPAALIVGYVATGVWIACLAVYAKWLASESILNLKPSEVGDFVAGAAAPMAFLWLVVAVFLQKEELRLQRKELRQSREALHRQADETAALVKHNMDAVSIAQETRADQRRGVLENEAWKLIETLADLLRKESNNVYLDSGEMYSHYALGNRGDPASIDDQFHKLHEALSYWNKKRSKFRSWGERDTATDAITEIVSVGKRVLQACDSMPDSALAARVAVWKLKDSCTAMEDLLAWMSGAAPIIPR